MRLVQTGSEHGNDVVLGRRGQVVGAEQLLHPESSLCDMLLELLERVGPAVLRPLLGVEADEHPPVWFEQARQRPEGAGLGVVGKVDHHIAHDHDDVVRRRPARRLEQRGGEPEDV